jgi:hypothetical protein
MLLLSKNNAYALIITDASNVDLPAFGKPMNPMSAMSFSLNSYSFFSPSSPN